MTLLIVADLKLCHTKNTKSYPTICHRSAHKYISKQKEHYFLNNNESTTSVNLVVFASPISDINKMTNKTQDFRRRDTGIFAATAETSFYFSSRRLRRLPLH